MLELGVGLEHRVEIDGQRADRLLDRRQPVSFGEVTEPEGLLDLVDELEVGRHAGTGLEPEPDRRALRLANPFTYSHR